MDFSSVHHNREILYSVSKSGATQQDGNHPRQPNLFVSPKGYLITLSAPSSLTVILSSRSDMLISLFLATTSNFSYFLPFVQFILPLRCSIQLVLFFLFVFIPGFLNKDIHPCAYPHPQYRA